MDPGMGAAQVRTLEERLQEKSLPLASALNIKQIIGAMDKLLVFQVSHKLFLFNSKAMWLDGSPLGYTLHSCLYLYNPTEVLDDLYFSPWMHLLSKQCIAMRSIIESTSEEDEFFRNSFGFEFQDKDEKEAFDLFEAAVADLVKRQQGSAGT